MIYALWSSNIDGTEAKLISGNSDNPPYKNAKTLFNSAVYGAVDMDFSPDEKMIATARQDYASNYQSPLWLMSYDGTNSRPIKISEDNKKIDYKNINSVKWQPDGVHLIFTVWDGKSNISYLTDINGTTPKQLTSNK